MGVVQDWITLELAIRIHNSKGHSDISEAAKKKLRLARRVLFAVISIAFAAFSVTEIVLTYHKTAVQQSNICTTAVIFGYLFLS